MLRLLAAGAVPTEILTTIIATAGLLVVGIVVALIQQGRNAGQSNERLDEIVHQVRPANGSTMAQTMEQTLERLEVRIDEARTEAVGAQLAASDAKTAASDAKAVASNTRADMAEGRERARTFESYARVRMEDIAAGMHRLMRVVGLDKEEKP